MNYFVGEEHQQRRKPYSSVLCVVEKEHITQKS